MEVALDAVIHLVTVGFGVVQTYQLRAACLDYRYWLLCPGALEIDLPGNLLLAHTAFAKDDAVGVGLVYAPDRLFNLLEFLAASWNQRIVKLSYNAFRLRILSDGFN